MMVFRCFDEAYALFMGLKGTLQVYVLHEELTNDVKIKIFDQMFALYDRKFDQFESKNTRSRKYQSCLKVDWNLVGKCF